VWRKSKKMNSKCTDAEQLKKKKKEINRQKREKTHTFCLASSSGVHFSFNSPFASRSTAYLGRERKKKKNMRTEKKKIRKRNQTVECLIKIYSHKKTCI
jgi:hypothetical protein